MNVMDDASNAPARSRRAASVLLAALALLALATLWAPARLPLWRVRVPGAAALAPAAHPLWDGSPARSGPDAVLGAGSRAGAAAAAAEWLAALEPARESLDDDARAFAADVAARHADAPAPALAEREACAALLVSRAALLEQLVLRLPAPYAGGTAMARPEPPLALLAAHQDVAIATEAGDPVLLEQAFARAEAAERRWFATGVPSPEATPAERGAAWSAWHAARAGALRDLAGAALAGLPVEATERVSRALPAYESAQASALARVLAALGEGGRRWLPAAAAPWWPAWTLWLALAAALGGGAGAWLASLRATRRAPAPPHTTCLPARIVTAGGPALHVIAGASPRAVARAAFELAAHTLAAGQRVLLIETSPRLALHTALEREARWGIAECLSADMRVLALVQFGGRPGLYFLAHGSPERRAAWSGLGRALDELEPHFDRIVLALAADAPRALGDAIVGRSLEAWWAGGGGRVPEAGDRLGDRLSMAFSHLKLDDIPEASLEVMAGRIAALAAGPDGQVAPPAAPQAGPAAAAHLVLEAEPVILDCDLQIQQRLRFLAWMRRVEKESHRRRQAELAVALPG